MPAAGSPTRISGSFAVPSAGATLVETTEPTFQPSGTEPGVDLGSGEFSAEGTDPGPVSDAPGGSSGETGTRRRAHSITASPIQGSGADVAAAVMGGMLAYTLSARSGPPIWAKRKARRAA